RRQAGRAHPTSWRGGLAVTVRPPVQRPRAPEHTANQRRTMSLIDRLVALYAEQGRGAYFGEAVTQTEHALQCACLAAQSGVDDELIATALLHDIGHLLHGLPEDVAGHGVDGRHEHGGAAWLERHFGPAV